jgi:hypothetical protein
MTNNNQSNLTREDASKARADKVNAIAIFIAASSDVSISTILNYFVTFGRMYDIDALLRYYDWARANDESDADILETIMHDLNGIKEDPNTFSPRSSSY